MIGIDTNVLLSLLTQRDAAQSERATKLIASHAPIFLNDIVLIEFVWVCRSRLALDQRAIVDWLEIILAAAEFTFRDRSAIERAVARFRRPHCDFADALIGEANLGLTCDTTMTFDKDASKDNAFELVPV